MQKVLICLLMASTLLLAGTKKIVVDLTTGDIENFKSRFLNGIPYTIDSFLSEGDRVDTAVVVHGDAYKFFIEKLENTQYGTDTKLAEQQDAIRKRLAQIEKTYGIKIEICQVGMNKRGILTEDLYPFAKPIRSSMTGLIRWQNAGYAYIPIP